MVSRRCSRPRLDELAKLLRSARIVSESRELTQNHEQLHHDAGCQESVAVYVPHATARLGSRDVDVEQLVLILLSAKSRGIAVNLPPRRRTKRQYTRPWQQAGREVRKSARLWRRTAN